MPTDTYTGTIAASEHVCALMRRINALEASAPSTTGTFISEFGSGSGPYAIRAKGSNLVIKGLGYIIGEWTTAGVFVSGTTANPCGETDFDRDSSGNFYGPNENASGSAAAKTVYKLDSSYAALTSWTRAGMNNPIGVCTDSTHVYIADYISNAIYKFDLTGTYVTDWAVAGNPYQMTMHPSGDIMVCGTSTGIRRYTNTGSLVSTVSLTATGIAFDASGNMYAVNTGDKIYVYDTSFVEIMNFGTSGSNPGEFGTPYGCAIDSAGYLHVTDSARHKVIKFSSVVTSTGITQTEFNSYTTTVATSLGTPDGGVSIPSLNGLRANGAGSILNHITSMRTAIETLAPYFTNPATSNPYNFTNGSADNLYYVAMGNRSAYGATGGAQYTWTRNAAAMVNTPGYGIDIGEVKECIATLEAS